MKSSKGNTQQEDEDEYEEDFSSRKEATSNNKDAKNNDKANAMRSKHSVTEQRRRSKINERFQILRDLVPHGDQKRDTASFLLEVIDYVQLLQEKVQKYEGSYQGWSAEPTKLMPWRHSHWRVQSFLGHPPQAIKNGPCPGAGPVATTSSSGKVEEKSVSINPTPQTPMEAADSISHHDASLRASLDQQLELGEKAAAFQMHNMPTAAVRGDGDSSHLTQRPASDVVQSAPCAIRSDDDQQGEHTIEGGSISISSAYSHGLLMTLTQALQSSGVDLSQASISIRIDLGKRANNQNLISAIPAAKEEQENPGSHDLKTGHVRDGSGREELDPPQKKLKSS